MSWVRIPPRAALLLFRAVLGVVALFAFPCLSTSLPNCVLHACAGFMRKQGARKQCRRNVLNMRYFTKGNTFSSVSVCTDVLRPAISAARQLSADVNRIFNVATHSQKQLQQFKCSSFSLMSSVLSHRRLSEQVRLLGS